MKKLLFLFMLSVLTLGLVWGQTNPTAHDLSVSDYTFTGFAEGTIITYPNSMQGWAFGSEPNSTTVAPATRDRDLVVSTTGNTTGGIRNEITNGLSILNSGSNHIGAIAVALNTTGRKDITLSWTAEDMVSTATRKSGLKLQYRIGTSGNFTDVAGTLYESDPAGKADEHMFTNIVLPADADNEELVQVRWLYHNISGSGSRDRIRLDDITITSSIVGGGGAATPPAIYNISTIPATDITPSTDVYVSATITDADGDVDSAELSWGLSSGNLPHNIDMVKGANDVWTTETPIPAQSDGTTVYYTIYALDDDANDTTSAEQSYISLTPQPQLNLSIATLSGFSYIVGNGPSAAKYFKVSGSNLTEDVLLTAPDHYEISLTEDADYDDALLLDVVGDELAETTLYVRLIAGLEVGDYNGEEVEIESSGVVKVLTLNGMVKPVPLPGYFVDFEDATKAAWAQADVELNGIEWSMEQALIGTDNNDMKEDNKAARIRLNAGVYGHMTMLQPKTGGIGTISFYYARANFSNDRTGNSPVFVVEYSEDGNDWLQVGAETDLAGIDELTLFSAELNKTGDWMVRIRQTAGDSGKRWNVDNIHLTDYEETPTADIPANVPTDIGTGVSITSDTDLNQGAPNDGQNAIIAALPNITNLNISVLTVLSGTGNNVTLTFDISAPGTWYGMLYVGGDWVHGVPFPLIVPDPGTISFSGVNFNAKGDVILLLGEGEDPTLPVELSSFLVSMNAVNQAVLTWISQSETALAGYYILRNNTEDLGTAVQISNLIPATNSSTPYSYSYVDSELNEHGSYYYWLQVNDLDGSIGYHGPINLVYGATEDPELPPMVPQTELKRIYPNPFNPSTNVAFYLAKAANVSLKIYNHRGQLVRSLHEGYKEAGDYRLNWDGKDEKGAALSTGVYFFRLEAGKKVFTQKAVLMK